MKVKTVLQGVALAASLVLTSSPVLVSADTGNTQVIQVSGTFGCAPGQTSGCTTTQIVCPPPEDQVDCVIDFFTNDLVGSDKLVTVFLHETGNYWSYEDAVTIDVTTNVSGVPNTHVTLTGTEHGVINAETGEFHGQSVSSDACGSQLNIHTDGVINLEDFTDYGTYSGTLVLKQC